MEQHLCTIQHCWNHLLLKVQIKMKSLHQTTVVQASAVMLAFRWCEILKGTHIRVPFFGTVRFIIQG